jgi:hypothetical protein
VHSQTTAGDRVDVEADLPRRLAAQVAGAASEVDDGQRRRHA